MTLEFYKYQGTGNDFVILDNRDGHYNALTQAQVRFLCDRRFGIGADGLMLLNLRDGYDFEMVYYNADGAESTMCGNGGRCLVQFAYDRGLCRDHYHFLAIDGPHQAVFAANGWVQLKMKDVEKMRDHDGATVVDTGSPHYVMQVAGIGEFPVFAEGKNIRNSAAFRAEGINVNFVEPIAGHLFVRTYERGVENETLSCGTGVTASALVFAPSQPGHHRVDVRTLGGDLAVEFDKGATSFSNIWLCGPATFVFSGQVEL